jgi:N-acetylglucosaminyldiphosphoundecaprenol N-acetyl-beta-D-mannosaminyltransferase
LLPILHASKPDIVFVALGAPKQELLICDLRPHMPAAWFLGIGISFSFVTGQVERAPKLLQNLGLEWMHRLVQEPKRLCKRYLVDGIPFAIRLLSVSAMRGMGMKK